MSSARPPVICASEASISVPCSAKDCAEAKFVTTPSSTTGASAWRERRCAGRSTRATSTLPAGAWAACTYSGMPLSSMPASRPFKKAACAYWICIVPNWNRRATVSRACTLPHSTGCTEGSVAVVNCSRVARISPLLVGNACTCTIWPTCKAAKPDSPSSTVSSSTYTRAPITSMRPSAASTASTAPRSSGIDSTCAAVPVLNPVSRVPFTCTVMPGFRLLWPLFRLC